MKKQTSSPKAQDRTESEAAVLRSIELFSSLSADELAALSRKMQRLSCKVGDYIFREGESGDRLFVLVSGLVAVTVVSDSEEIELSRLGPGAFFGEMAILEQMPRSASCRALEASECLALEAEAFDSLLVEMPNAAAGLLERMLTIAAGRLLKTGAFLSQMVQWGDTARRRAITDAATGLFNRRYLEESGARILAESLRTASSVSFAMFDLDRFGKLNASYGAEFCDHLILDVAAAFRQVFAEEDILVRYGGDEFCFLLPHAAELSLEKCEAVCAQLRSLRFDLHPELRISCSIGLASAPEAGSDLPSLMEKADKALYLAKEGGRDRAIAWKASENSLAVEGDSSRNEAQVHYDSPKVDIPSIAKKDRIEQAIVKGIDARECCLVFGHRDPDDDCIAAMVAVALLASKFGKKAAILLPPSVQENHGYLLDICRYNQIAVIRDAKSLKAFVPAQLSALALVLVDTPKPAMIDRAELLGDILSDPRVLKIEVDHHLESDSAYFGDEEYRLVYDASSSCEIIGRLALKLAKDAALLESRQVGELITRNLALAILSGMVGDSQLGKYLRTEKARRSYTLLSTTFEDILGRTTRAGSGNFSTMEQLYKALAALSHSEEACFEALLAHAKTVDGVRFAVLDSAESSRLISLYGTETVITVSKAVVDQLAEESGKLGLVGYYDDPARSNFVQFRLRRSQGFEGLDLRTALIRLGIENGGGHAGAVGMRLPREEVSDIASLAEGFAGILSEMLEGE